MKPANYAPVYAGLYPELAEIARAHGYAMAVHGSMARDADLICIPWIDEAADPQKVVDAITSEFAIQGDRKDPRQREHGRLVYTLTVAGPGCFIDLSFTPRQESTPTPSQAQDGYGAPTGAECARCRELDAHLHAIRSVDGSCPQCADTKRECANIIAEFEVERRAAECAQGNPND